MFKNNKNQSLEPRFIGRPEVNKQPVSGYVLPHEMNKQPLVKVNPNKK